MIDSQDEPPLQCSSHLLAKACTNSCKNNADTANTDKCNHNSSQHSDSLEHSTNNLPFSNGDATASDLDSNQCSEFPEHSADNLLPLPKGADLSNHDNSLPEHSANNLPLLEGDANNDPTNDADANDDNGDKSTTPSNAAPSPFPQHEKTTKADDKLVLIQHYLSDPHPLPHLHGNVLTHFLCRAARFSLAEGRLWRLQADR